MRTGDTRAAQGLKELRGAETADTAELLDAVRPSVDRLRRGEWRLLLTGPRNSAERDEAAMFQARLLELLESLSGPHR